MRPVFQLHEQVADHDDHQQNKNRQKSECRKYARQGIPLARVNDP